MLDSIPEEYSSAVLARADNSCDAAAGEVPGTIIACQKMHDGLTRHFSDTCQSGQVVALEYGRRSVHIQLELDGTNNTARAPNLLGPFQGVRRSRLAPVLSVIEEDEYRP